MSKSFKKNTKERLKNSKRQWQQRSQRRTVKEILKGMHETKKNHEEPYISIADEENFDVLDEIGYEEIEKECND
jgi:dTDP-4-dehydrorhamnose 3,5-epimerase-like enzyme